MNNPHFILDYETIGQDVFKAPVVNCAYFIFDWDRFTSENPYTFNELIRVIQQDKVELEPQVKMGYTFSKRDINWWMEQGAEARKQIKPSPNDVSVGKFVQNLKNYVQGTRIKRWWSRSNTFDPIFLHRNFQDFLSREQLDEILPFWLVRDIRTYIDTRFDFNPNMKNGFCPIDDENLWNQYFIPHNSIHDVAADILRIQRIERTIHLD